MAYVILIYTKNIFSLDYYGVKILIPYYINIIKKFMVYDLRPENLDSNSEYKNLAKVLKVDINFEVIKIMKISSIDIMKLIFSLSIVYKDLPIIIDQNECKKLGSFKIEIMEITIEILESFESKSEYNINNLDFCSLKNFSYEFKNNLFTLLLCIIQDLRSDERLYFEVIYL